MRTAIIFSFPQENSKYRIYEKKKRIKQTKNKNVHKQNNTLHLKTYTSSAISPTHAKKKLYLLLNHPGMFLSNKYDNI